MLRHAIPGMYKIKVKLFHGPKIYSGTCVSVRIWTHFGNAKMEKKKVSSVRLGEDGEEIEVARVLFP